jgi:hypothetical protein
MKVGLRETHPLPVYEYYYWKWVKAKSLCGGTVCNDFTRLANNNNKGVNYAEEHLE